MHCYFFHAAKVTGIKFIFSADFVKILFWKHVPIKLKKFFMDEPTPHVYANTLLIGKNSFSLLTTLKIKTYFTRHFSNTYV